MVLSCRSLISARLESLDSRFRLPLILSVSGIVSPMLDRLSVPRASPSLASNGWEAAVLVMARAGLVRAVMEMEELLDGLSAAVSSPSEAVLRRALRAGMEGSQFALVQAADRVLCAGLESLGFDLASADELLDSFAPLPDDA